MRRCPHPANLPVVLLWLFILAVVSSTHARADFKDDYKDGVKAFESKDYATAERKLRAALADSPQAQQKVRLYGMRFDPYLPHHYLALSLAARGRCGEALQLFSNSSHRAIVGSVRGSVQVLSAEAGAKQRCNAVAAQTPVVPEPKPPVPPSSGVEPVTNPPVQTQVQIQTPAQTPTQTPTQTPADPVALPTPIRTAAIGDAALLAARTSVAQQARDLAALKLTAAKLSAPGRVSEELTAVELKLNQSRGALESAAKRDNAAEFAQVEAGLRASAQLVQALKRNVTMLATARTPAPAALAQIAKLYFAADFKAAAQQDVNALSGKAKAHALLLRAAAKLSIHLSEGGSDPRKLADLSADLQNAKLADVTVLPSANYFSPQLIAIFQKL